MKSEKTLFIIFASILAINIITLITVWPYVCVRGCCRCKSHYLSYLTNRFELAVCKKDHSRTDYRKA